MLFDLEPAVWWTRFEFVNSPLVLKERFSKKKEFCFYYETAILEC